VRGVSLKGGKYVASMSVDGAYRHIGAFSTLDEARSAYVEAKRLNHPFSTRMNKEEA
jgi:hypothetical protein